MNDTNATLETVVTNATYRVHESKKAWLTEKLAKLNRKATRLGTMPVTLTWGEDVIVERTSESGGAKVYDHYTMATVTGIAPKVGGWTFVATLQHADEAGNVIRSVPGTEKDLPLSFRTVGKVCQHCNAERRRKDTYVLRNDAGEYKQVGANCLGDFLGGRDPHAAAMAAEIAFEVAEAAESSDHCDSSYRTRVDLTSFLAQVAAVVRIEGRFVSRKAAQAYEEAGGAPMMTSGDIASICCFPSSPESKKMAAKYMPTNEDVATAEAALAWVEETFASKDPDTRSDFEHNLVVVTSSKALEGRSFGLAAAVVGMYRRHIDGEVERKAREEAGKASQHFGAIKERVAFQAKLLMSRSIEGFYGTTYLYKLITAEGNLVTWFSSGNADDLFSKDEFRSFIGTVKAHEEFKGEKQTTVNRVAPATEKDIEKLAKAAAKKAAKAAKAAQVTANFDKLAAECW